MFGQSKEPPKASPGGDEPVEEMSNDPEAGLDHLTGLMRQFNQAVADKQFDTADKILKRAESGIDKASPVTRSHPDFDDMADTVHRGRPKLELAIETDRIQRRNAAIDNLIDRGNQAMQHNATWLTELASRAPTTQDVQDLDEAVKTFAALKKEGENFLDEPRYRAHADKRDAMQNALAHAEDRAAKEIQLTGVVVPAIDAGFAAADRARSAQNANEQFDAFKDVAQSFRICVNALGDQVKAPGFDGNAPLDTRFGHLTFAKTLAQCTGALGQATDKLNRFGWDVLVGNLNRVVPVARGTGAAANAAQNEAIRLLTECSEQAPGALTGAVAQKALFDTVLGNKLKVASLVQACKKENTKLKARGGVVGWQSRFEAVRDRANAAHDAYNTSISPGTAPARAVELMGQAVGGFVECSERSAALWKEPLADKKFKVPSAFGQVGPIELGQACKKASAELHTHTDAVLNAKKQADFVATCHGDEVDVAQREGIPLTIEKVGYGRVFVYPQKRIAFDPKGMRTDEALLRAQGK